MQQKLNLLDLGILFVMLFKVQFRLLVKTSVDGAFNISGSPVEQEQCALIYKCSTASTR